MERRLLTTCDVTGSFFIQLAIIIFTMRKIRSLTHIVKHLFIKIVIQHPTFHDVPRFSMLIERVRRPFE